MPNQLQRFRPSRREKSPVAGITIAAHKSHQFLASRSVVLCSTGYDDLSCDTQDRSNTKDLLHHQSTLDDRSQKKHQDAVQGQPRLTRIIGLNIHGLFAKKDVHCNMNRPAVLAASPGFECAVLHPPADGSKVITNRKWQGKSNLAEKEKDE